MSRLKKTCFPSPQALSHPKGFGGLVLCSKCSLAKVSLDPSLCSCSAGPSWRSPAHKVPKVLNPTPPPCAERPQNQALTAPDGGREDSPPGSGRREHRCRYSHTPGPALAAFNWLSLPHLLLRIYGPFSFKALNHSQETCGIMGWEWVSERHSTCTAKDNKLPPHTTRDVPGRKFLAYIQICPFLTVAGVNYHHVIPDSQGV